MKIVGIFKWVFLVLCFVFIIANEAYGFSPKIRRVFSLLLFLELSINLCITICNGRRGTVRNKTGDGSLSSSEKD